MNKKETIIKAIIWFIVGVLFVVSSGVITTFITQKYAYKSYLICTITASPELYVCKTVDKNGRDL